MLFESLHCYKASQCSQILPIRHSTYTNLNFSHQEKVAKSDFCIPCDAVEVAAVAMNKSMSVSRLHQILAHFNEHSCRTIAKYLNIRLDKDPLPVCESVMGNAR